MLPSRSNNRPLATLWISNLAPSTTEKGIFDVISTVGPIASIRIARDVITRRSLGYGHINFMHIEDGNNSHYPNSCFSNSDLQSCEHQPAPTPVEETDSLASLCLNLVVSNFRSFKDKKLAVLDKLPIELSNKIVERLDYLSFQEIYYSQHHRRYISSTQFSFRLYNQEKFCRQRIGTAEARPHLAVHLLTLATPLFDNIKPFHATKRDAEEIALTKIFTNEKSKDTYEPSFPIVETMEEFGNRFEKFTDNILEGINWDNLFCAGGSVLASLMSQEEFDIDKRRTDIAWKDSDIDLFIYGLPPIGILAKSMEVYNVITSNLIKNKQKFLCCVSNRVLTVITEPPYRNIQIVNHRYSSIDEALCSFDLDCCCVGYDGKTVWAIPRGVRAITRRYNLVDPIFDSPTYCYRLKKYAKRGFCVAIDTHSEVIAHNDESIKVGLEQMTGIEESNITDSSYTFTLPKAPLVEVIAANKKFNEKGISPYTITEELSNLSYYANSGRPANWSLKFPIEPERIYI